MYYLGDVQMVKFKIKATRFMLIKFTTSGRPMTVFPESRNSMCYLNKRLSILRTILVPQKGLYFYFHYLGKLSRRGRGGALLKTKRMRYKAGNMGQRADLFEGFGFVRIKSKGRL